MCLAVPGKIINISGDDPAGRTGKIDFGGIVKEVSLSFLPNVKIGNYVIVHAGFALSIVNEKHALKTLKCLKKLKK